MRYIHSDIIKTYTTFYVIIFLFQNRGMMAVGFLSSFIEFISKLFANSIKMTKKRADIRMGNTQEGITIKNSHDVYITINPSAEQKINYVHLLKDDEPNSVNKRHS